MTEELASSAHLATIGKAHVFVSSVLQPQLGTEDRHHLERVLRLGPNEIITVSDGLGHWRCCQLRSGDLLPMDEVVHVVSTPKPIGIAVSLLKGDRTEWVVQKLVEIGIDRITLLETERTIVHWPADKRQRQLDRLRKVAREAAMQSRQPFLAIVDGPRMLADLAGLPGVALAHHTGGRLDDGTSTLVVGPEGGWSQTERDLFSKTVTLGSSNLRAETAAVFGAALLVAVRTRVVVWT